MISVIIQNEYFSSYWSGVVGIINTKLKSEVEIVKNQLNIMKDSGGPSILN